MVTLKGFSTATGPAWIGSRSPAVVGARLQRGPPVASVASQVLQPVKPPLELGDHAAQLFGLQLCDIQLLLGLGSDGGTLADLDLVYLRLALQALDLPLEVHDSLRDVLGDVRFRWYIGGSPAWWPSAWGSSRWSSFRRTSGWSSARRSGCSTIRGSSAVGWVGARAESHIVVGVHVSPSGSGSRRGLARVALPTAVGRLGTLSIRARRGFLASSATGSGHFHLAARGFMAMPAVCPSSLLQVTKRSESWGYLWADLRGLSGVFPLPLRRGRVAGLLSSLL